MKLVITFNKKENEELIDWFELIPMHEGSASIQLTVTIGSEVIQGEFEYTALKLKESHRNVKSG